MLDFRLAKWSAVAPGLTSETDWSAWLESGLATTSEDNIKLGLKKIPPMLRRRFTPMGKVAAAALYELDLPEHTPLVFASRHGDVDLTLSLLQDLAQNQALSPTSFSLAVHNAIAGLLSIARQDTSTITSIAACRDMLPLALLEAATQLQDFEQVVCLLCDTPVPDVYQPYTDSSEIPYAVALLLSRDTGIKVRLARTSGDADKASSSPKQDYQQLLTFLFGGQSHIVFPSSAPPQWALTRI